MIQFVTFILLFLFHFITGCGLLSLLQIRLKTGMQIGLSVMIGIIVASWIPFLLQLLFIPLTTASVFGSWAAVALILNLKMLMGWRKGQWQRWPLPTVKLYEWPFILYIGFVLFIAAWRSYYLPPTPRDLLSGPETIAAYAVTEHSFINSVFTLSLDSTNNIFKSPYLTSLQYLYKIAGFPFGSVWLSMLVISFFLFLYQALCRIIHPVLTGALLLLLIAIPELYAYSFMVLYDYSAMVFFTLGFYFIVRFATEKSWQFFHLSAILMAASVYIRSEGLLFSLLIIPIQVFVALRDKIRLPKLVIPLAIFVGLSFLAYWIPVQLYNNHYLPQHYRIDNLINDNLLNLAPLWERFREVNSDLIFSEWGVHLYGYIIYVFLVLFATELIFKRKFSRHAALWLYGIAVIYFGLILLGFVFPLMDIHNSTKRGLFRLFPLILFYIAHNAYVRFFSDKLSTSPTPTGTAPERNKLQAKPREKTPVPKKHR